MHSILRKERKKALKRLLVITQKEAQIGVGENLVFCRVREKRRGFRICTKGGRTQGSSLL